MTIPDTPRPVVENAHQQTLVVRIIAAANLVLAGLPALLLAFEVIAWNAAQISSYGVFLGVVTTAALLLVGQQVRASALVVESQVTPVATLSED